MITIGCSKHAERDLNDTLIQTLKEEALRKNPKAQFALGMRLIEGTRTDKEISTGIKYLKSASLAGDGYASLKLAELYLFGKHVDTNFANAFYYANLSSKDEVPEGILLLGFCYANGIGTSTNLSAAVELYKRAADRDLREALWSLGKMYLKGIGMPRNSALAKELFQRAAEKGHSLSQSDLAGCYLLGDGTEVDYMQAPKWATTAGKHGCSQGFNLAGLIHEKGMGVAKNEEEACRLYELAAKKGNQKAQVNLGFLLVKRARDSGDKVEAYKWLYLAAEAGESLAKAFVTECETNLMSKALVTEGRRRAEAIQRESAQ